MRDALASLRILSLAHQHTRAPGARARAFQTGKKVLVPPTRAWAQRSAGERGARHTRRMSFFARATSG